MMPKRPWAERVIEDERTKRTGSRVTLTVSAIRSEHYIIARGFKVWVVRGLVNGFRVVITFSYLIQHGDVDARRFIGLNRGELGAEAGSATPGLR